MSQQDILGRDPLKADRDSIWMKPGASAPPPPRPAQPQAAPQQGRSAEKDYSKVVLDEASPDEAPAAPQGRSMVKEGPPLVPAGKTAPQPKGEEAKPSPAKAQAESMPKPNAVNPPREAHDDKGVQETVQLIGFKLEKEFFGIRIINVQEIIRHQDITMVPRTPEFVEGVISLRGRVIPVINLRKRFSMDLADRTKETRIVIVELDCGTVGFIVDAVTEVTSIPKASIDPAPPTATGVSKEYIQGVGKMENKLMIILDLNQVLSKESKQKLKQMLV